ncbi:MAG TPA: phasin family protein, partial [Casimicrobiaceae bacterium]|nr:phasin family protein [Casimicrobiaceae bacterium]
LSAEDFTKACAAWFDQANRLQEETLRFAQERLTKELETAGRLARCTNPTDAFNLQIDFAATAAADYLAEGQKMVAMLGETTAKGAGNHHPRGSRG